MVGASIWAALKVESELLGAMKTMANLISEEVMVGW